MKNWREIRAETIAVQMEAMVEAVESSVGPYGSLDAAIDLLVAALDCYAKGGREDSGQTKFFIDHSPAARIVAAFREIREGLFARDVDVMEARRMIVEFAAEARLLGVILMNAVKGWEK